MVDQLQEEPQPLRIQRQMLARVRAMFDDYQQRYIDCWEPRPCPSREEFP